MINKSTSLDYEIIILKVCMHRVSVRRCLEVGKLNPDQFRSSHKDVYSVITYCMRQRPVRCICWESVGSGVWEKKEGGRLRQSRGDNRLPLRPSRWDTGGYVCK